MHGRIDVKEKLLRLFAIIEQFFLGTKFNAIKMAQPRLILAQPEIGPDLLNELKLCPKNSVIWFSAHPDGLLGSGLRLKPQYLEQLPVMIEKILETVPHSLLLIDSISALPTKAELSAPVGCFGSLNKHWEFYIWLKDFQQRENISLIVIEQAELLGQKNSALLGRLMNT